MSSLDPRSLLPPGLVLEAVQVTPEFVVGLGNGEHDASLRELLRRLENGLAAGEVDVVHRVGEQDQPARRLWPVRQSQHLPGEPGGIGVEEAHLEAVDDQTGLADSSRRGRSERERRATRGS